MLGSNPDSFIYLLYDLRQIIQPLYCLLPSSASGHSQVPHGVVVKLSNIIRGVKNSAKDNNNND